MIPFDRVAFGHMNDDDSLPEIPEKLMEEENLQLPWCQVKIGTNRFQRQRKYTKRSCLKNAFRVWFYLDIFRGTHIHTSCFLVLGWFQPKNQPNPTSNLFVLCGIRFSMRSRNLAASRSFYSATVMVQIFPKWKPLRYAWIRFVTTWTPWENARGTQCASSMVELVG